MFEKFLSSNVGDFNQRYRGTYGYFIRRGKRILVQLVEITNRMVIFEDRDGISYTLKPDAADDVGFEFIPPKCQYYNMRDGKPVLIKRMAAKQYSRGICQRNTTIELLRSGSIPINIELLERVFEDKVGVEEALQLGWQLRGTDINSGVALSKQFAYSFYSGKLKCFNMDVAVGTMDINSRKYNLKLLDTMWRQEVLDVLRRNNFTGELA